jgi:hypothetical protein
MPVPPTAGVVVLLMEADATQYRYLTAGNERFGAQRAPFQKNFDSNGRLFVNPEKRRRQRDSREQTNGGDHWPLAEPVRHDDSDHGRGHETSSSGEHEITERRRLPSRRTGNVRILMHK